MSSLYGASRVTPFVEDDAPFDGDFGESTPSADDVEATGTDCTDVVRTGLRSSGCFVAKIENAPTISIETPSVSASLF